MRGGGRLARCNALLSLKAERSARLGHRYRSTQSPVQPPLNPRWLSDVKSRIGYCLMWGLQSQQIQEAGKILREVAQDWRGLSAGSEGFLTSKQRRSTFRYQVVWGQQDAMGHVNNVVYNRFAETGRVDWFNNIATFVDPANASAWRDMLTPKGDGLILRKITTEFKFPMRYPDHVTILHKLATEPKEGTDTFDLHVLILSELHQRPAARVIEDVVFYDYRKAKKTPLRPFMLDVLQHTWKLQEEAKRVNSQRVSNILERVRALELESWNREGAVEDMGSAST
ncbi:hypothetical protein HII31_06965 [Pseudocercospora fuligena]|uniref:Thioesterase domain-containing protein n=1 Tax=Pseudocercospora fuligena TaxID=685502 RepID=A0A8H6RI16_9PEZI|nr:hypothetical protein HII31_06965 [Pseudocercospora fuligena]